MFVKLTHLETGKDVYILKSLVRMIDQTTNGQTRVVFSENHAILVNESLQSVVFGALVCEDDTVKLRR